MKKLIFIVIVFPFLGLGGCSIADDTPNDFKDIVITGAVYGFPADLPDSIFLTIEDNTIDDILVSDFVKNQYNFEFDLSHHYTLSSSIYEDNFTIGIEQITDWNYQGNKYKSEIRIVMYENE